MSWESIFDNSEVAPQKSFDLLPKGIYRAVIESAVLDTTKNPVIVYTFKISDGEFKNRKIWSYKFLSEKAIAYTKAELQNAAGRPFSSAELPSILASLVGQTAEIFVSEQAASGAYKAKNTASINHMIEDASFHEFGT